MKNEITEDMMKIITRAISIHAPCYKVPGYEQADIKQEAFLICMKIVDKWDGVRPFENFLVTSLSNRLKTFVRDKVKSQGCFADVNQKLQSPIDIDNVDWDLEKCLILDDNVSLEIEYRDLVKAIDQYLPISLRRDYLQMKAGVKINRGRQDKIREYITLLLVELRGGEKDE